MLRRLRFRLRVWWSRSLTYQAAWLLSLCGISLAALWLGRGLSERSAALTPRLFDTGRQDVWLALNARSSTELAQLQRALKEARYGVPVTVIRPELKLIGTVEGFEADERTPRVRLGIYQPELAQLTTGASVRLQVEPPTLSLLIEDVVRSPRGQVAIKRVRAAWAQLRTRADELLSLLLIDLKGALPKDLLDRLSRDPVVLERAELHFQAELIDQLPWGQLLNSTLESEEFESIRSAALDGIKLRPIFAEALKGASQHAVRSKSVMRGFTWRHPIKSGKKVIKQIREKKDKSLDAGAQRARERVMQDIKTNLEREQRQIKKAGGALLARQAKEAKLDEYVVRWVEAVTRDEVLLTHLKGHYQPELMGKVKEGLSRFKERSEVQEAISTGWAQLLEALTALAQAVVFDHKLKDPGPNPLFVSVVEELIRGDHSPSVHVIQGEGAPVKPGHIFKPTPPERRPHWLTLLSELNPRAAESDTSERSPSSTSTSEAP